MRFDHTDAPAAGEYATVYLVFELSKAKSRLGWLLKERTARTGFYACGRM